MQSAVAPETRRVRRVESRRLSHERGPTDSPLLEETIGVNLRRAVARFGEREALVVGHQCYRATYRDLWEQVDIAARTLIANGVRKGDRVGIWAPNRYEWVVVQFATARVGAILVTINPDYKAAELRYALHKARVSMLVMARAFREADYVALLAEVRGECPDLRLVLVLEDGWETFLAEGASVDARALAAREASLDPADPINIQYTSGTTGFPKGATLSHRNILNNAHFTARKLGYARDDRVCVPVPFYHCFGMVLGNLGCVTHGACIVVPGEAFDARDVLAAVSAERCTSLYGVPTMFMAELGRPDFGDFDLTSLRTGAMGGAPCPVELMEQVRSRMHMDQVTILCGMTETSPVSTQTAVDDPLEKRVGTVGRVHPHVEVKVIDEDGVTVPRGVAGEQCTRGYSVMLGYWEDPVSTRRAIDVDGWMHTGDLAVMDEDGLPRDRRPDQGHDHPRRGEHLPARDRGVPLPAAGDQRGRGDRRPERAVRRGGHGLGSLARRRESDRRRSRCRLPRAHRASQDPAPLEDRRLVPEDRHRQDPEIPHARGRDRRARTHRRRRSPERISQLPPSPALVHTAPWPSHPTNTSIGGSIMIQHTLNIRSATPADDDALARLASLSHRHRPTGRTLIAEDDASVVAAIALTSGMVLTDPCGGHEEALNRLKRRRYELQRQGASGYARSLMRRLGAAVPVAGAA